MRVLAHIREQYSLSLGSYGRPRMTMELKEAGLTVGERRVGRLMKINGRQAAALPGDGPKAEPGSHPQAQGNNQQQPPPGYRCELAGR